MGLLPSWIFSCRKSTNVVVEENDAVGQSGQSQYFDARSDELGMSSKAGPGAGAANGSVYYDARQSESGVSAGFVPLQLSLGTSLDNPGSVLGRPPNDEADEGKVRPPSARLRPSSTARYSGRRRSSLIFLRKLKETPNGRRRSSLMFLSRRKLEETPKVSASLTGYPGHLSESEMEACLEFRRRLRRDDCDPIYREMVYCFKEVEEEPFAICRYLRARKFQTDDVFQMMDERSALWRQGREHDFFPDPCEAIGGAPESALLTQFPLILGRTNQNGCPILYFSTGQIRIEGIECITSMEELPNYIWHLAVHKVKHHIAAAQAEDPSRVVRVQVMVVVDLKGLALSTLQRAMGALERALKILSVFPEFLYNVVITNVPRFFAAFWPVIKAFMDPATARKFELYSSAAAGRQRLLELIPKHDLASDFGGTAPSTADEVTRHLVPCEGIGAASRHIMELLMIRKHGAGEVACSVVLAENEIVAISVYTNSTDGADVILTESNGTDPRTSRVKMVRGENEAPGGTFSRDVASSLHGPGKFRLAVKQASVSSANYFLIIGNVYLDR